MTASGHFLLLLAVLCGVQLLGMAQVRSSTNLKVGLDRHFWQRRSRPTSSQRPHPALRGRLSIISLFSGPLRASGHGGIGRCSVRRTWESNTLILDVDVQTSRRMQADACLLTTGTALLRPLELSTAMLRAVVSVGKRFHQSWCCGGSQLMLNLDVHCRGSPIDDRNPLSG